MRNDVSSIDKRTILRRKRRDLVEYIDAYNPSVPTVKLIRGSISFFRLTYVSYLTSVVNGR